MLDSSDELADQFAAFLSHPKPKISSSDDKLRSHQLKKMERKKLTSISARGVRAETESTQMRSMAPDLHIRSATEIKEC